MKGKQWVQTGVLLGITVLAGVMYLNQQGLRDWWRLRGYTAPQAVSALVVDVAMTDEGRPLLYVNQPQITTGTGFTDNCPASGEKTVVLGCYLTNDNGIFIYDVTDERLNGVEQVTAAHEMLHAAYDRLSKGERERVDAMLMRYYNGGLTDQRIKDTIEAYKISEPNDVVNEMHSIFGTEVADLPDELETYYAQYFTDRSKVAGYTARYQGEFTSRQAQIAQYDAQLQTLKAQFTANQSELKNRKAALDAQSAQMQKLQSGGQVATYNAQVSSYNRAVSSYNTLLNTTKDLIQQYNDIVDKRNAVVLEEQQLAQALSASALE